MTKTPKAYSYVRFSTPEQMKGDSLRRQTEMAADYAERHGLELDNGLSLHDLGVSAFRGTNARTGALGQFLKAIDDGLVEENSYLLVENLDRVSRADPWDAIPIFQQIINAGITIVTLMDQKVYSKEEVRANPMRILESIFTMIRANEESATKSRRIRAAWMKKRSLATDGTAKLTARAPAWLLLSKDRKEFTVIEDRAAIVKRIFREADKGMGQHAIAEMLNREGVDTFGDGNRKAAYWHRSYVAKILRNPAVTGTLVPHVNRENAGKRTRDAQEPIPGYYPRIVSMAQFKRIHDRSTGGVVKMRSKDGKVSNVLAGLAKCPRCGGTMSRVNKGRRGGQPYLVCNAAKAKAGCDYKQVKLELIENALLHHATRNLVHDVPSADETLNEKAENAYGALMGYDNMIDEIVSEIARGNASDALRKRLTELESLRATADTQWQHIQDSLEASGGKALERTLAALEEKLPHLSEDPTTANLAMRDAFEKVVVDYETGGLELHWRHAPVPTRIAYDLPKDD